MSGVDDGIFRICLNTINEFEPFCSALLMLRSMIHNCRLKLACCRTCKDIKKFPF